MVATNQHLRSPALRAGVCLDTSPERKRRDQSNRARLPVRVYTQTGQEAASLLIAITTILVAVIANPARAQSTPMATASPIALTISTAPPQHEDPHAEEKSHDHQPDEEHAQDLKEEPDQPDDTGTDIEFVEVSSTTRQNLGITFVQAEKRPVRSTIRLPGQFELRPKARRDYHTMLSGRVDLLVNQYQKVTQGDPLFRLDSPEWQQMQNELVEAYNNMRRSHADVSVAEAKLEEQRKAAAFLASRINNLAQAQVRQVELEAELAEKNNAIPRLEAEVEAAQVAFDAAHTRYDVMVQTAASVTGIPLQQLDAGGDDHPHIGGFVPKWRSITQLTIRAEAEGVVDRLAATNRGWVETGDLVLDTIDPHSLRFHADALQTDIMRFSDGMSARIVPPPGGSIPLQDTAAGKIDIGFQAHPEQRTIPIYVIPDELPNWGKAGVTAYLEVFVEGSEDAVVAVPEAAVIRDGLEHVLFMRHRMIPDMLLRVPVELGTSDGRWIEVKSVVQAGDEIVLGGVYPLMLATSESGERQSGVHVHPDGSVHEDH